MFFAVFEGIRGTFHNKRWLCTDICSILRCISNTFLPLKKRKKIVVSKKKSFRERKKMKTNSLGISIPNPPLKLKPAFVTATKVSQTIRGISMRMGFMCSLFFLAMGIGSGIGIGYAIFNSDDKKEDMTVTLQANTDNSVVALYWMEFNSSRSIYDSQSLFIQKDEILPVQDNVLTIALSESNIRENALAGYSVGFLILSDKISDLKVQYNFASPPPDNIKGSLTYVVCKFDVTPLEDALFQEINVDDVEDIPEDSCCFVKFDCFGNSEVKCGDSDIDVDDNYMDECSPP